MAVHVDHGYSDWVCRLTNMIEFFTISRYFQNSGTDKIVLTTSYHYHHLSVSLASVIYQYHSSVSFITVIIDIKIQTWTASVIFSCLSKIDKESPKLITWWLLYIGWWSLITYSLRSDQDDQKITHPVVNCFRSCKVDQLKFKQCNFIMKRYES